VTDPRMEVDALLRCPHCGDCPYMVFRIQNVNFPGTDREQLLPTFHHQLWPHPDHPWSSPPTTPWKICCPTCGEELRRVAP